MVEALAHDFWPLTPRCALHPSVVRLLRRLTFLWAGVNLAIGGATFTLLLLLPLPAYVALKQPIAWSITAAGIAITIDRAVRTAASRLRRRSSTDPCAGRHLVASSGKKVEAWRRKRPR
jgi:hypothetical protein